MFFSLEDHKKDTAPDKKLRETMSFLLCLKERNNIFHLKLTVICTKISDTNTVSYKGLRQVFSLGQLGGTV